MITYRYETIGSTNTEAIRRLGELPSLCVLSARDQTAGRGQRGNTWFTEPGKNLTFSIVVKFGRDGIPELAAKDSIWLNYLMSYVVFLFLNAHGADCSIKWPNDIYVGRRKICGMLIENTLKGEYLDTAVIGVGININQKEFPQLANATSLGLVTGEEYGLEECLDKVCRLFEEKLPWIFSDDGRRELFSAYSGPLFQKGVSARYHDYPGNREYRGIIRGVGADGRLCIQDLDAPGEPLRHYRFKEIGYIL